MNALLDGPSNRWLDDPFVKVQREHEFCVDISLTMLFQRHFEWVFLGAMEGPKIAHN